jgi:hypothetical protein
MAKVTPRAGVRAVKAAHFPGRVFRLRCESFADVVPGELVAHLVMMLGVQLASLVAVVLGMEIVGQVSRIPQSTFGRGPVS